MKIITRENKKDETKEWGENATLSAIKSLKDEELCLTEARDELLTLKGDLQLRAKEKIETVTRNIQKLKNEVAELKLQCEQLKEFISDTQ